jgi:ABC-type sugar transport system substrate-binding protein
MRWKNSPGRMLAGVCTALLLLSLAACGRGQEPQGGAQGGGNAGDRIRIGWVAQNFSNPAIVDMVKAGQDEAKTKFPNVEVTAEDSQNLEDQISKAETLIAQGVDVLGLQPWEGAAIRPVLDRAKSANIPVFLTQDDAPGAVEDGLAVTYIASDEVEGGRLVGKWVAEQLGGSGDVALIEGAPGDSPARNRTDGFEEAIKGTGIKIVARDTGNWARDQGLRVATDILTAQPNLKAIFAHNDEMAFGALQALRAARKDKSVKLVGYNGTCIGLEATIKGQFNAEGVLFLDEVGRQFIRQAVANKQGESVQPRIQPPIMVLDTKQANAMLEGQGTKDEALLNRLKKAQSGAC